ncbi:MAG: hypothetical protein A2V63_11930 [Candidatus Eisenbacteria bacterium RBG_19FT_COMBO_70_11]|nr:MAG: hypothetical protein A2V63_11930 [Candidatus Eisenbacteria bacterium RBG_19FT_COMBO_70_11]
MKRLLVLLAVAAASVFAALAVASSQATGASAAKAESKPSMVKGEIVDMGCYMGHGARGEKHQSCAAKCIAGGMPMGLLTDKGALYLLTMNHDNADPFNQCKEMAAAMVEVTGMVSERNGMKSMDVMGVKPLATAESTQR